MGLVSLGLLGYLGAVIKVRTLWWVFWGICLLANIIMILLAAASAIITGLTPEAKVKLASWVV